METIFNNALKEISEYGYTYFDWQNPERNVVSEDFAIKVVTRLIHMGYFAFFARYGYCHPKQGEFSHIYVCTEEYAHDHDFFTKYNY